MLTVLLAMAGPLPPILPDIGAERPPWVFEADVEALLDPLNLGIRALTSVTAYGGMVRMPPTVRSSAWPGSAFNWPHWRLPPNTDG